MTGLPEATPHQHRNRVCMPCYRTSGKSFPGARDRHSMSSISREDIFVGGGAMLVAQRCKELRALSNRESPVDCCLFESSWFVRL